MEASSQLHALAAVPSWKTPMTIECTLQVGRIGSLLWEGSINYFFPNDSSEVMGQ